MDRHRPYPVDRPTYEKTIDVLHQAVNRAKIERSEKIRALKRLAAFMQAAQTSL